jgi:dolichol-phosphate mannosyltransferase
MKLSVVIPAHNEASSIAETLQATAAELDAAGLDHELLVVDDHSSDGTSAVVATVAASASPRGPGSICSRAMLSR